MRNKIFPNEKYLKMESDYHYHIYDVIVDALIQKGNIFYFINLILNLGNIVDGDLISHLKSNGAKTLFDYGFKLEIVKFINRFYMYILKNLGSAEAKIKVGNLISVLYRILDEEYLS